MSEREKTTKLDEVMTKLGRGMNEENPLDKLMEDETWRLADEMKKAEIRKLLAQRQAETVTAELEKARRDKELEDFKKAKAKEEKLELQPPVAAPLTPPAALLDFTKLPPEAQKDFLDKGGLDTLLKLSLLQNPKSMENPIALMLLMGAAGRQQGLDPALIGELQKSSLTAITSQKDAEADAKLARQEATSTKEMYDMKDKMQAAMNAEIDRRIPLTAAVAPKDVKTQMTEIKEFVEAMREFSRSGLLGPEAIKEDDGQKWAGLLTGVQVFAKTIPQEAWLNFANAAINMTKILNERVLAGVGQIRSQTLVQQQLPQGQVVEAQPVVPQAIQNLNKEQVERVLAQKAVPALTKTHDRLAYEDFMQKHNYSMVCDVCLAKISIPMDLPSGSEITCPICKAKGLPEPGRWPIP